MSAVCFPEILDSCLEGGLCTHCVECTRDITDTDDGAKRPHTPRRAFTRAPANCEYSAVETVWFLLSLARLLCCCCLLLLCLFFGFLFVFAPPNKPLAVPARMQSVVHELLVIRGSLLLRHTKQALSTCNASTTCQRTAESIVGCKTTPKDPAAAVDIEHNAVAA